MKPIEDREHLVQLSASQTFTFRRWLEFPNGSLSLDRRFSVNAVEGGGILIRTQPYSHEEGDR